MENPIGPLANTANNSNPFLKTSGRYKWPGERGCAYNNNYRWKKKKKHRAGEMFDIYDVNKSLQFKKPREWRWGTEAQANRWPDTKITESSNAPLKKTRVLRRYGHNILNTYRVMKIISEERRPSREFSYSSPHQSTWRVRCFAADSVFAVAACAQQFSATRRRMKIIIIWRILHATGENETERKQSKDEIIYRDGNRR